MFFFGCIKNCFSSNDNDIEQLYSLNTIIKLKVYHNDCKMPEPIDKEGFINIIKNLNITTKTVLGGSIEFILLNPDELPVIDSGFIRYIINMRNTKTLLIMNTYNFIISFDKKNNPYITISPYKNEKVSISEWNFLENLFYNMNYQTIKCYKSK